MKKELQIGGEGTCHKCGRKSYSAIIAGWVCPCEKKDAKKNWN